MRVRAALPPQVPVGCVDAYVEFLERPALVAACDLLLPNCYPFWEGANIDVAAQYVRRMHGLVKAAGGGAPILPTVPEDAVGRRRPKVSDHGEAYYAEVLAMAGGDTVRLSQLYEVFLQATNLQSLGEQFEIAETAMKKYFDEGRELSKNIKVHEEHKKVLSERLDLAASAPAIEKEIEELHQRKAVRELQDLQDIANKVLRTVDTFRESLVAKRKDRDALKANLDQQGEPLRQAREELARLQDEEEGIERAVQDKVCARTFDL